MTKSEDVLVDTIVKTVEEKAPEVVAVVEEIVAKKSCSCLVFGWNIIATKSSPKSENVLKVD